MLPFLAASRATRIDSPEIRRTSPLTPAAWPVPLEPVTLSGNLIKLEPIGPGDPTALVEEVARAADDDSLWRFFSSDGHTPESAPAYVADLAAQWRLGNALPFAVRLIAPEHAAVGRIVGVTRLKDAVRAHRRLSVGSWFTRTVWGRGVNAESKGLLLAHAFEQLGAFRVDFETDSRNARSRAALAALGAVEEGVLRAHRITRGGGRRDSVVFSVIADEWPAVRERIAARVAAQR